MLVFEQIRIYGRLLVALSDTDDVIMNVLRTKKQGRVL